MSSAAADRRQMADFTPEDVANKIWLRRTGKQGETRRQYRPLAIYLDMPERSLRAVAKETGILQRTIENWSSTYEWVKRACAYDAHMEAVAQAERERLARENEAKWERRREAIREAEFEVAMKLVEKFRGMAEAPLYELREEAEDADGCTVTVKMPAGWRLRDMPRVAESASKLARLSAEMATERQEIDIDISNASDEQLDEIIRQGRKA
jgi:transposase-like protein